MDCILLDRKSFPRTKACGSGLSPWTLTLLDDIGVGAMVRQHAYRIDGAVISGADGEGLELRGDHETAILRRAEFDELLAKEAARRGADLRDGVAVKKVSVEGSNGHTQMAVETSDGVIEADLIVDCTGATGRLDRYSAPPPPATNFLERKLAERGLKERMTLHTIMGWYQGVQGCSDVVELFFDRELRPHYAWIFPETAERVNIGLCFIPQPGGLNAKEHFEAFLDRRLRSRLHGAEQLGKWIGHPVRVSAAPQQLISTGVLRAGEAGWLADSATAEGIYHALLSGRVAGRYAAELFGSGKSATNENLQAYGSRVTKALMPRLAMGRALMGGLKHPTLDWALKLRHLPATKAALSRAFTGLYHG